MYFDEKKLLIVGLYVKRILILNICFFSFFLSSCDEATTTDLEVVNNSSYNLHLHFILKRYNYYTGDKSTNIKKGETLLIKYFLGMAAGGKGVYGDPNLEIDKIIFTNLDTNEIIRELKNNNHFTLISRDGTSYGFYKLEITDDLLYGNTN